MAHDLAIVAKARAFYVFENKTIKEIASDLGIGRDTISRWKSKAGASGDDWDKRRLVASMATQGASVIQLLLQDYTMLHHRVVESVKNDDMQPLQKAETLSRLARSFQRTVNAANKTAPDLSRLGVTHEVLKSLSEFVNTKYPQHAAAFLEILEPFGQDLTKSYG